MSWPAVPGAQTKKSIAHPLMETCYILFHPTCKPLTTNQCCPHPGWYFKYLQSILNDEMNSKTDIQNSTWYQAMSSQTKDMVPWTQFNQHWELITRSSPPPHHQSQIIWSSSTWWFPVSSIPEYFILSVWSTPNFNDWESSGGVTHKQNTNNIQQQTVMNHAVRQRQKLSYYVVNQTGCNCVNEIIALTCNWRQW